MKSAAFKNITMDQNIGTDNILEITINNGDKNVTGKKSDDNSGSQQESIGNEHQKENSPNAGPKEQTRAGLVSTSLSKSPSLDPTEIVMKLLVSNGMQGETDTDKQLSHGEDSDPTSERNKLQQAEEAGTVSPEALKKISDRGFVERSRTIAENVVLGPSTHVDTGTIISESPKQTGRNESVVTNTISPKSLETASVMAHKLLMYAEKRGELTDGILRSSVDKSIDVATRKELTVSDLNSSTQGTVQESRHGGDLNTIPSSTNNNTGSTDSNTGSTDNNAVRKTALGECNKQPKQFSSEQQTNHQGPTTQELPKQTVEKTPTTVTPNSVNNLSILDVLSEMADQAGVEDELLASDNWCNNLSLNVPVPDPVPPSQPGQTPIMEAPTSDSIPVPSNLTFDYSIASLLNSEPEQPGNIIEKPTEIISNPPCVSGNSSHYTQLQNTSANPLQVMRNNFDKEKLIAAAGASSNEFNQRKADFVSGTHAGQNQSLANYVPCESSHNISHYPTPPPSGYSVPRLSPAAGSPIGTNPFMPGTTEQSTRTGIPGAARTPPAASPRSGTPGSARTPPVMTRTPPAATPSHTERTGSRSNTPGSNSRTPPPFPYRSSSRENLQKTPPSDLHPAVLFPQNPIFAGTINQQTQNLPESAVLPGNDRNPYLNRQHQQMQQQSQPPQLQNTQRQFNSSGVLGYIDNFGSTGYQTAFSSPLPSINSNGHIMEPPANPNRFQTTNWPNNPQQQIGTYPPNTSVSMSCASRDHQQVNSYQSSFPGLQSPTLQAPGLQAPTLQAPGLQAPTLQAPGLQTPGWQGPGPQMNQPMNTQHWQQGNNQTLYNPETVNRIESFNLRPPQPTLGQPGGNNGQLQTIQNFRQPMFPPGRNIQTSGRPNFRPDLRPSAPTLHMNRMQAPAPRGVRPSPYNSHQQPPRGHPFSGNVGRPRAPFPQLRNSNPNQNQIQTGRHHQMQPGRPSQIQTGRTNQIQTGRPNQIQPGRPNQIQTGRPNQMQPGRPNQVQPGRPNNPNQPTSLPPGRQQTTAPQQSSRPSVSSSSSGSSSSSKSAHVSRPSTTVAATSSTPSGSSRDKESNKDSRRDDTQQLAALVVESVLRGKHVEEQIRMVTEILKTKETSASVSSETSSAPISTTATSTSSQALTRTTTVSSTSQVPRPSTSSSSSSSSTSASTSAPNDRRPQHRSGRNKQSEPMFVDLTDDHIQIDLTDDHVPSEIERPVQQSASRLNIPQSNISPLQHMTKTRKDELDIHIFIEVVNVKATLSRFCILERCMWGTCSPKKIKHAKLSHGWWIVQSDNRQKCSKDEDVAYVAAQIIARSQHDKPSFRSEMTKVLETSVGKRCEVFRNISTPYVKVIGRAFVRSPSEAGNFFMDAIHRTPAIQLTKEYFILTKTSSLISKVRDMSKNDSNVVVIQPLSDNVPQLPAEEPPPQQDLQRQGPIQLQTHNPIVIEPPPTPAPPQVIDLDDPQSPIIIAPPPTPLGFTRSSYTEVPINIQQRSQSDPMPSVELQSTTPIVIAPPPTPRPPDPVLTPSMSPMHPLAPANVAMSGISANVPARNMQQPPNLVQLLNSPDVQMNALRQTSLVPQPTRTDAIGQRTTGFFSFPVNGRSNLAQRQPAISQATNSNFIGQPSMGFLNIPVNTFQNQFPCQNMMANPPQAINVLTPTINPLVSQPQQTQMNLSSVANQVSSGPLQARQPMFTTLPAPTMSPVMSQQHPQPQMILSSDGNLTGSGPLQGRQPMESQMPQMFTTLPPVVSTLPNIQSFSLLASHLDSVTPLPSVNRPSLAPQGVTNPVPLSQSLVPPSASCGAPQRSPVVSSAPPPTATPVSTAPSDVRIYNQVSQLLGFSSPPISESVPNTNATQACMGKGQPPSSEMRKAPVPTPGMDKHVDPLASLESIVQAKTTQSSTSLSHKQPEYVNLEDLMDINFTARGDASRPRDGIPLQISDNILGHLLDSPSHPMAETPVKKRTLKVKIPKLEAVYKSLGLTQLDAHRYKIPENLAMLKPKRKKMLGRKLYMDADVSLEDEGADPEWSPASVEGTVIDEEEDKDSDSVISFGETTEEEGEEDQEEGENGSKQSRKRKRKRVIASSDEEDNDDSRTDAKTDGDDHPEEKKLKKGGSESGESSKNNLIESDDEGADVKANELNHPKDPVFLPSPSSDKTSPTTAISEPPVKNAKAAGDSPELDKKNLTPSPNIVTNSGEPTATSPVSMPTHHHPTPPKVSPEIGRIISEVNLVLKSSEVINYPRLQRHFPELHPVVKLNRLKNIHQKMAQIGGTKGKRRRGRPRTQKSARRKVLFTRMEKTGTGLDFFTNDELWEELIERQKMQTCVCGMTFVDMELYECHKASHDSKDPHKCPVCLKTYTDWLEFTSHSYGCHKNHPQTQITL